MKAFIPIRYVFPAADNCGADNCGADRNPRPSPPADNSPPPGTKQNIYKKAGRKVSLPRFFSVFHFLQHRIPPGAQLDTSPRQPKLSTGKNIPEPALYLP